MYSIIVLIRVSVLRKPVLDLARIHAKVTATLRSLVVLAAKLRYGKIDILSSCWYEDTWNTLAVITMPEIRAVVDTAMIQIVIRRFPLLSM